MEFIGKGTISIFDRQKMNISNVEKVIEANDKFISLNIDKANCQIKGSDLQIEKLDITSKQAEIVGIIDSVVFTKTKQKILGKLFK